MPKQIYKIENFHGGLNSNSDPRDIADSQSPDCNDVAINNVGRITLMGKDSNTGNVLDYGNDLPCVYNSGLFSYSHDYRISDGSEGSEFLYVNYDGTDDVEVTGSDGDNLDFSLSSSVPGIPPSYSLADGDLRVSDTGLTRDTKWFGHIKSARWDNVSKLALTSPGWTSSDASLLKPTAGNCIVSTPVAGTETGSTNPDWDNTSNGGVNSSSSELIGLVSNGLIDDAAINLRVGVDYTSNAIYDTSTSYHKWNSSADNLNGSMSDDTDVIPFIGTTADPSTVVKVFDNSVTGTLNGIGLYNAGTDNDFTIDDDYGILIPIYFISSEFTKLDKVYIKVGTIVGSSDDVYTWNIPSTDLKADMWNLILLTTDNYTGKIGTPNDFGSQFNSLEIDVYQKSVHSSDVVPNYYVSGVSTIPYNMTQGFPIGSYTFHYTWLYDNIKQESLPFQLEKPSLTNTTGVDFKGEINIVNGNIPLTFQVYLSKGNGSYDINKRITGSRIYFQTDASDEYYLIGEVDFVKEHGNDMGGFKFLADSDVIDYTFANAVDSNGNLNDTGVSQLIQPVGANGVDTFKTINGFSTNTNDITARYKTSTLQGRRMFIGNVKHDADGDGTSELYGDRMLKSVVNKFDTYPSETSIVDVAIRDGESIVKLESYADRILQFKQKSLYIVNVSETVEFLEDIFRHKGVNNEYHVVKTDYGVAWFNQYGAYFYDGQNVSNLLENNGIPVIDIDTWQAFLGHKQVLTTVSETVNTSELEIDVTDYSLLTSKRYIQIGSEHMYITAVTNPTITVVRGVQNSSIDAHDSGSDNIYDSINNSSIGYIPKTRQLIISNEDENVYIYDFTLKAWTKGTDRLTSSSSASTRTNFVLNQDDDLIYGGAEDYEVVEYKWSGSPSSSAGTYSYKTRDIDFANPGIRKKIFRVRISYKGDGSGVTVAYAVNGDTNTTANFYGTTSSGVPTGAEDSTPLLNPGTDDWLHCELKPYASINNIYSFQLIFGGTAASDFEINDISVVYRLKPVK